MSQAWHGSKRVICEFCEKKTFTVQITDSDWGYFESAKRGKIVKIPTKDGDLFDCLRSVDVYLCLQCHGNLFKQLTTKEIRDIDDLERQRLEFRALLLQKSPKIRQKLSRKLLEEYSHQIQELEGQIKKIREEAETLPELRKELASLQEEKSKIMISK